MWREIEKGRFEKNSVGYGGGGGAWWDHADPRNFSPWKLGRAPERWALGDFPIASSMNDKMYSILYEVPSVDVYSGLRAGAGLSAKTEEAAARGLAGSLFAVQMLYRGQPIGMGRVIDDGGCFYQVVDIAVLPEHQGRGLGKRIMHEVMAYLGANVPDSGYVGLIADGRAPQQYARFGFVPIGASGVGMAQKWPCRSGT